MKQYFLMLPLTALFFSPQLSAINYYCEDYYEENKGGGYWQNEAYYHEDAYNPQERGGQVRQERMLSPADRALLEKIQNALERNGQRERYRNINIHISNGYVTIKGFVRSDQARQEIKNKIRSIQEIRGVNDQLQIHDRNQGMPSDRNGHTDDSSSYRRSDERQNDQSDRMNWQQNNPQRRGQVSDQELRQNVQEALEPGLIQQGYENIQIDVRNGTVILKGTVATEDEKEEIIERINEVYGVKNIDHQLNVNPDAKKQKSSY